MVAPAVSCYRMICKRCSEIAETFVTEGHGELCEACQQEVQSKDRAAQPPPRRRLAEEL